MNPLMVSCGLRKEVDLFLGDRDPVADRYLLPNQRRQVSQCFKCFHRLTLTTRHLGTCQFCDKAIGTRRLKVD